MFKKGDPSDCSNYRGISLLSVVSKLFESVLLTRLRNVRDERVRKNQAGFRPGRGCIDQIFTLRQVLELRNEFQQPTIIAFLDFTAAFDSLHRDSLWAILRQDGVPEHYIQLFQALYRDTFSVVRAGDAISEPFCLGSGVRQGAINSPMLFNYVMDWILRNALRDSRGVHLFGDSSLTDTEYADDVAILSDSAIDLQNMIDTIAQHAAMVGLSISVKKSKILSVYLSAPVKITVGSEAMEQVTHFRYLGSEITVSGDATIEISARIARAQLAFLLLSRCLWLRLDISISTKCHVYTAAVRSILLYGCETWPLRCQDIHRLAVFEHHCLRKILRVSFLDHICLTELYRRCGLEQSMETIIIQHRWSWLGHVLRMPSERLAKRAFLTSNPVGWKRPRGCPKMTWTRLVKSEAEKFLGYNHLPGWSSNWKNILADLATDRAVWRGVIRDVSFIAGQASWRTP